MSRSVARTARAATVTAVTAHLGAVGVYAALGLAAQDPLLDPWRPISIAALYAVPAVLAAMGMRRRRPLLLAAAVAALGLALLPISLHSFVLGPAGIVYGASYVAGSTLQRGSTAVSATLACVLLLTGAFALLVVHDVPVCYTKLETGEVVMDDDPAQVSSGTRTIDADSGVVQAGCTSDTVAWWQGAGSIALSGAAVLAGRRLVRPVTPTSQAPTATPDASP